MWAVNHSLAACFLYALSVDLIVPSVSLTFQAMATPQGKAYVHIRNIRHRQNGNYRVYGWDAQRPFT